MKQRIAAVFSILLMLMTMLSCFPAPGIQETHIRQETIVSLSDATPSPLPEIQTPSPTQEAKESPTPDFDVPWYRERNTELADLIKRYNPTEADDQIEQDIARMAIDPDKPMVALTFDDGPYPGSTDQVLDVLEENNARATFYVCGWHFEHEKNQDILRRMAALGCEIGNHTWSHRNLLKQNYVSVRYEVKNTNDIIYQIAGVHPRTLRPPGGRYNYEAIRVARENGMAVVLWSQSGNVHESDPSRIAQNVEKQIVDGKELHDGDIILLHDSQTNMVDAVKIIVPQLIQEGYQLVTVWELLNCSDEGFVPGALYDRQQTNASADR